MGCMIIKKEKGCHPNIDCVLMIKILLLQQWYDLSDVIGAHCTPLLGKDLLLNGISEKEPSPKYPLR